VILMYHHIAPPEVVPRDMGPLEGWNFTHSPISFETQLVELHQRGYHFVSLDEFVSAIQKHGSEPKKTVALTFDDGWMDNFTYALPILMKLSITATFFCTTNHIYRGERDAKKMAVVQLQELLVSGMTIGGHTRSHPDLTKLSPHLAKEEIAGCKIDLEQALGTEVKYFAYPGGAFNRDVASLAQESGYTAACSVLGPAINNHSSLFWLYRDLLSTSMTTWGDRYRLCPAARRLFEFRVKRRLKVQLRKTTF